MKNSKAEDFAALGEKIDLGIRRAYRKLVEKEAKEGGSLLFSVNGKITDVPAIQLLEALRKKAS